MRRLLAIALAFWVTQSAFGLGPMIRYHYGNSVAASDLSIQLDGTIQRTETRGGVARAAQPDVMLTPATRKQLFDAIMSVYQNKHTVAPGPPATADSRAGSLKAFSMNGPIVIREIERGQPGGNDTVTTSDAPEAQWIESLVNSLVRNRMDE